jgi:hypothetical protein
MAGVRERFWWDLSIIQLGFVYIISSPYFLKRVG